VTATAAGIATPANFTLTNTKGPLTVKVSAGNKQHTTVNTPYTSNLQARVTDSHGKPVANIMVVFELPGTGASGTFASSAAVLTNASGVAMAPTLTANAIAGKFSVSAWVTGIATPATFTLTNTAAAAAARTFFGTSHGAKLENGPLESQVVDTFNNPAAAGTNANAVAAGASAKTGRKLMALFGWLVQYEGRYWSDFE